MNRIVGTGAAIAIALASGCTPHVGVPGRMPAAYPSPPNPALSNLVGSAPAIENEIAQNLANPVNLTFPVRVGVLYYGFTPTLKPEVEQEMAATFTREMQASGLVSHVVFIPPSLTSTSDSVENIRKLASRFQSDVVLFIDGSSRQELADRQEGGFFGQFSSRTHYESRTLLTGLAMGVLSGRFLPPVQVVGHSGPKAIAPEDAGYTAQLEALQQESERGALLELERQFVQVLRSMPGAPAAPATP